MSKDENEAETPRQSDGCVVLGVGASAGGLGAYKRLLQHMPADTGMAFVFVQHLAPAHESLMVELLSKVTSMPVSQVNGPTSIEPNHVYMIPPNKFIKIHDGTLFLDEPVAERGVRLPIDYFFRSLASARKERSICVVLSGTGSDGAAGIREIKAEGGMTIVQEPTSAEHDGMPRSAISTGAVDFVLSIEEMSSVIIPYARHPYVQSRPTTTLADTAPDHYRAILNLLRAHTDHDFSRYKPGTLTRRISRRMSLRQISQPADYLKLLREDGDELRSLFKDMLIGVTRFFRDVAAWDALANVVSPLLREKKDDDPFRVWVPGCATGEEAYSIAMLLFEQQHRQKRRLDIQIFASDIDSDAIDVARFGVYPENVAWDIPDSQLDLFFQREAGKLRVRKKLREVCVFAVQNLLSDPPFSALDLICCRNLLIYLESDIQRRVFDMLHFALKPSGILFLGSAESPANRKELFEVVSQPCRIYRKKGESKPGSGSIPVGGTRSFGHSYSPSEPEPVARRSAGIAELSKRALLEDFVPASVVVNQWGLIQYIQGSVHNYLSLPSGEPQLELGSMANDGLEAATRSALQRARAGNEPVTVKALRVVRDGRHVTVRVRVRPLATPKSSDSLYLVSFMDESSPAESLEDRPVADAAEDVQELPSDPQLALALQATREDLHSTIEALERANEELKASNEEVMSMNEELQSTNEELETSHEELQSLNEELSTVNNQLHDKLGELEETTNDLTNLLVSTDLATLFLDSDLRIRRFTLATMRLMSLLDSDVGRPLVDLAPLVDDPNMVSDAKEVLRHLAPIEKEVHNRDGRSYIRRITPFRTSDNKIEGVVITFSDVTGLREAAERVAFREKQQSMIAQLGHAALATDDLQKLFERTVRGVADTLGVQFCKILRLTPDGKRLRMLAGVGWRDGLVGTATVTSGIHSQAGYTLQSAGPVIVTDLNLEKRFSGPPLLTEHGVTGGVSVVIGPGESPWGVLGVHTQQPLDLTIDDANFVQAVAHVLWDAIEREAIERRFRTLVEASAQIVWTANAAGKVVEDSPSWRSFTGQTRGQWQGFGWLDAIHPDDRDRAERSWQTAIAEQKPMQIEYRLRHISGGWRWMEVRAIPQREFDGDIRGWIGMSIDITEPKQAEEHQTHLAAIIESSSDAIIGKTLDGTITSWNQAAETLYGYTAEEIVGKSIELLIPSDRNHELDKILAHVRAGKSIDHYETRRRGKDGAIREVSLTISPIWDVFGNVVGGSTIARDVTHQNRMQRQLEQARIAAEAASEAKSAFLANMSHEIRTPMTAILGYADLLHSTLGDADAQACVQTIKENGVYLCEILNDILDLSKIEAGKIEVHLQPCSLVEILAHIRSLMAVRATEKSLALSIDFDGPVPNTVRTDPKLVRQILVNLIGNAIKFTEHGQVRVRVKCHQDEGTVEVAVTDTGIGIAEEKMGLLFQPFEQVDNSFTRAAGGSGLGLSISKRFAELLNGTIRVDSQLREGSTFRLTFDPGPLDAVDWYAPDSAALYSSDEDPTTIALPRLAGRILAVDDRREIRYLVRQFVRSAGAQVDAAENGQQAVEAWQRGQRHGTPYDLILMDIQMPVMDGLQATRKLRAEGYRGPLIALTANVMQRDRQTVMEAGFDDFLPKPIDQVELLTKVKQWLATEPGADENAAENGSIPILCVDDNVSICTLHRKLLEKLGHQVQTATSGSEALEVVRGFTPQLAFLDLGLPNMSGGELLSQLKSVPALASCRFVCLSGHNGNEVEWRELGFDTYLQKPAAIQDLKQLIDRTQRERT